MDPRVILGNSHSPKMGSTDTENTGKTLPRLPADADSLVELEADLVERFFAQIEQRSVQPASGPENTPDSYKDDVDMISDKATFRHETPWNKPFSFHKPTPEAPSPRSRTRADELVEALLGASQLSLPPLPARRSSYDTQEQDAYMELGLFYRGGASAPTTPTTQVLSYNDDQFSHLQRARQQPPRSMSLEQAIAALQVPHETEVVSERELESLAREIRYDHSKSQRRERLGDRRRKSHPKLSLRDERESYANLGAHDSVDSVLSMQQAEDAKTKKKKGFVGNPDQPRRHICPIVNGFGGAVCGRRYVAWRSLQHHLYRCHKLKYLKPEFDSQYGQTVQKLLSESGGYEVHGNNDDGEFPSSPGPGDN